MISSIAYFIFGILAIALIVGIIIIVRNQITITAAYKLFKKRVKTKQRIKRSNTNPELVVAESTL